MKRSMLILILVGSFGILGMAKELWAKSPFFTADDIVETEYLPLEEDLPN